MLGVFCEIVINLIVYDCLYPLLDIRQRIASSLVNINSYNILTLKEDEKREGLD